MSLNTNLNKILTTIENNNFNHKNKIGKFKFGDINNLISTIKNNTVSEADTKKKTNELNKIKNVETKGKRLIDTQKPLLSLFHDLKTIFINNNNNNNNNNNESNSKNVNENESKNENKNESESENENEYDEYYYEMRQINNWFETIDQTKPLED